MNRPKLSKLILDKQSQLGMTQEQFAEYFSQLGNHKVTYGFVQTLTSPKKTGIPEWRNMVTIAKMWNVSLDELQLYLEDDSITNIQDVSKVYRDLSQQIVDRHTVEDICLSKLESSDLISLGVSLIQKGYCKMSEQVEWAKSIAEMFKKMGLSQS